MVKTVRAFFLSLTILAFLLFSTIGTTTAYADDGTGTEPPATETPTESGDPPTVTVTEETSPPAGEEQPPAETVAAVLEQVPDNTTVTVLNAEGETLPLASQESAEVIASDYDPIWCPAGQVPTPGANGCTVSFDSFDELLVFLLANEGETDYQKAGTIYIQQGPYEGGETSIDFNDYAFTQFNTYDLTLQGGWDTSFDPAVNPTPTYTSTTFAAPITIGSSSNPWAGSLTINNISISGVDQTGLTLYSDGDINLSQVEVTDSASGAQFNAGGDVTVEKSKFNNNGSGDVSNPVGKGLEIVSGGTVTLKSVEANKNQLFGASVQAVGNVAVTNGFFNGNQGSYYSDGWVYEGYGLKVVSASGNILLDTVTANDNYLYGASLQGAKVDIKNSSFNQNDSDWHEHSIGYGLKVVGTGNVTLAGVTANENQRFGADIQTAGAVTVTNSFFNGNQSYTYSCDGVKTYYGYGIKVVTSREVSFVNVTADNNFLFGARIEAKDVAIDTASFSNNGSGDGLALTGRGLEVVSVNDVAITDLVASNNQLFGADIKAGGLVAIQNSQFNGHIAYVYDFFSHEIASRSGGFGLRVVTPGSVALENITANGNYLYGTSVQSGNATVENSTFINNGSGLITEPVGYGLKVVSTGAVTLIGVNASDNQLFGADIEARRDVTIVDSFFSGHQTVTFTPCDGLTFYGYGLTVVTAGDVSLDGVKANFNNLWGASLTGNNIFVYNSQFNNNVSDSNVFIDDTGLIVKANGFVDIFKVEAKENRLIGATITAKDSVSVADSVFTDNRGFTCLFDWCPEGSITYHGYGLQVTTPGEIIVTNTIASNNNLFGAELNGGLVTVENSTFANNGMGNGLTVKATDNVTLTNVTATKNGGNGVDVDGVCQKTVTVTGGTFSDNALFGLKVVDATLAADGTQVFANNGSGNIFTDTSTCVVVVAPVALKTTVGGGQAPAPIVVTTTNTTNNPAPTVGNAPSSKSEPAISKKDKKAQDKASKGKGKGKIKVLKVRRAIR